jgi:hypothetical protein
LRFGQTYNCVNPKLSHLLEYYYFKAKRNSITMGMK